MDPDTRLLEGHYGPADGAAKKNRHFLRRLVGKALKPPGSMQKIVSASGEQCNLTDPRRAHHAQEHPQWLYPELQLRGHR